MDIVCPKCRYGSVTRKNHEYVCRNPECGHRWQAMSETLAHAFTAEGRRSCPELFFHNGELFGQIIPLDEGTTLIGRDAGCQIRLTNLAVSRVHAQILKVGSECGIQDKGSRIGVFVNDRKVDTSKLENGDRILIAGIEIEFRVRYEADSEVLVTPVGNGETGPVNIRQKDDLVHRIELEGPKITIGRGLDRDVVIEQQMISRRHAVLILEGGDWYVVDTKSSAGTFVNGRSVIRQKLVKGDRVQFGTLAFLYDGGGLQFQQSFESLAIRARKLTATTPGGTVILDRVPMVVEPGELVGILGPSGSGKTTLLDALSGGRPAGKGQVSYNNIDLYSHYQTLRTKIGYVPQDDIIHLELTPHEALTYAARLRLPKDTSLTEIGVLVEETLTTLGLGERAHVRIDSLSGGQRKRVSLGVELLTRCNVLFLDEPTSGLDPATEARMMRLFRRLADQGRAVILTTHVMENIDLLDKIAVLYGGKLVYYGPPREALKYFGAERATSLYDRLEASNPDELQARFEQTGEYEDLFGQDDTRTALDAISEAEGGRVRPEWLNQLNVLTRRYLRITVGDLRNLGIVMAQPLIIFSLICLTFGKAWQVLFLSAVAIFWVGCTNAAREIVREQSVFRRERMVGLAIGPYVLSKVAVIAGLCLAQALVAVGFIKVFGGIDGGSLLYLLAFFVANLSGMALGLFISAMANRPEHAQAVVPIVLVPQIIFAGMIEPVADMNAVSRVVSYAVSTRWTYESLKYVFWERSYDVFTTNTLVVAGFVVVLVLATVAILKKN